MTGALLKMKAFVQVAEGSRVYYDCPAMSGESSIADSFFKKYRGKIGLVKGFSEKFVGPLDLEGRSPGAYIKPGYIHVQFEDEENVHQGLNLHHFVLLDVGKTVVPTASLEHQRVRDLPEAIEFWPGDRVRKADDLLRGARIVEHVRIADDGAVTYVLAECNEIQQYAENCAASDLALVARGNVYHLYHDSSLLTFASPEEEVTFWGREGVSRKVYIGGNWMPRYEWPFDEARQLVEKGEGDLVIASKQYENVIVTGRGGDFEIRKLHPCFAQHRERVRALSASLAGSPVKKGVPFCKSAGALFDVC